MQVLQVQLAVQADPAEVGRARRWVRSRLQGQGVEPDAQLAETLVLVVSELVTNAVVHTGCPAVLRLSMPVCCPGAGGAAGAGGGTAAPSGRNGVPVVRVEVADASRAAPAPRHAAGDATNGRGLELVEMLCDRWGWYPDGSGKRVWCEIGPDLAVDHSVEQAPAAGAYAR
ncbi:MULTISPECIES: ATP-binding protein [Kitasatospora]|uniref:ATP-binding protein n=1 Tax=Kitasatospora cystarginea TaxID=58350 RepID=A0ABP5RAD0_9ACTN